MSKITNKTLGLAVMFILLLSTSFYPWFTAVNLKVEQFSCQLKDENFTLQWIHSVERELWRESYRAEDNHLLLFLSQFKTFGAGTPYSESSVMQNGFIELNPNLTIPKLYWVISRNVESTIITEQGTIPIYQFFKDYTEVTISTIQQNFWTQLKDSCHEQFATSH